MKENKEDDENGDFGFILLAFHLMKSSNICITNVFMPLIKFPKVFGL